MQAYMKSEMPFYGVQSPGVRAIAKQIVERHPFRTYEAWRDTVRALWREASRREERYVALEIAGHRKYRPFRMRDVLWLYEEFVVSGAWWDLVDATAHLMRDLVRDDHMFMAESMRAWAVDANLWKRRAAIISQLGLKTATDWDLLRDCIDPNLDDREFWIRKAIGWALREYGKSEPDLVRAYVVSKGPRLHSLSRREAMKHLGSS
jgi:3-methyladenine DNA glycosylase AlkD